jgi:hypothetical protein
MPFVVKAHVDDVMLSAKASSAKEAFAKAIEWHVAQSLTAVSISDGIRHFTIAEFASKMALLEIENTVDAAADGGPRFANDEALSDLPSARSPPVPDVRRLGAASQADPGR